MSVAYHKPLAMKWQRGLSSSGRVCRVHLIALAVALGANSLRGLQQQINEAAGVAPQSAPAPKPTEDMLSF